MPTASQDFARMFADAGEHHAAGRLDAAEAGYRHILQADPRNPDALHLLGTLIFQKGDAAGAIRLIEKALKIRPDDAAMLVNISAAHRARRSFAKAAWAARRAMLLSPELSQAHLALANALFDAGDMAGAIEGYQSCLALKPGDPIAHIGIGNAHKMLGRLEAALDAYDAALLLDPEQIDAVVNISAVLREFGYLHAALVCLERAVAIAPRDAAHRFSMAASLLQLGKLNAGWPAYDARFDAPAEGIVRRPTPPAYWQGEPLADRSIVVWTEQGLGDEIMHASMLGEIVAAAGRCVIECSERMVPVFARSFPRAAVTGYRSAETAVTPAAGIDFQISVASLGQYLRPDFARFPRHAGYLKADPARVTELRERYLALAAGRRIVGISWRSKNEAIGAAKSARLVDLAPLLTQPDVFWVNLQYGDCRAELAEARERLGVEIHHDSAIDPLADMDGFFAQVAAMDLAVTTSNTAAHVAGALNVPVWVLLPYAKGSYWYWFVKRADSPWYPSARLFRASKIGDGWATETAERAARELGDPR